MNNLSSYCGLVDAKIRASDKDLPVQMEMIKNFSIEMGLQLPQLSQKTPNRMSNK